MSTHNPRVAKLAALSGVVEMILFSINPAFDLLPASEDLNDYFAESYEEGLRGIDPERAELYKICEQRGVGITVMKGYGGGRLFSEKTSPLWGGADAGPVYSLRADPAGGSQHSHRLRYSRSCKSCGGFMRRPLRR